MATDWPSEVLRAVLARPVLPGGGRIVGIDGPAGSGKSTLAAGLAALAPHAVVVNTDQLLDGWDGLPTLPPLLVALAGPVAGGVASTYRRYDWVTGRYAERVPVPWTPLLVIEGVGAGARELAPYRSLLVWVDAPADERWRRVVERDGPGVEEHLAAWVAAEAAYFSEQGVSTAADLHVTGGADL